MSKLSSRDISVLKIMIKTIKAKIHKHKLKIQKTNKAANKNQTPSSKPNNSIVLSSSSSSSF